MSLKFIDGAVVEWLPGNASSDQIYFVDGAVVETAWFEAPAAGGAITCDGVLSMPQIGMVGEILAAPKNLYINDDNAQSGRTNPQNIADTTPNFSAEVSLLDGNITDVQVIVSAAGDQDFSEALNYDSGWHTLTTPVAAAGRTEDVTYGD